MTKKKEKKKEKKEELINPDWQPSKRTLKWCKDKNYALDTIPGHVIDFKFHHEKNETLHKDFDMAFAYWMRNIRNWGIEHVANKHEDGEKKASPSYGTYTPLEKVVKNKASGREALKELKGKI